MFHLCEVIKAENTSEGGLLPVFPAEKHEIQRGLSYRILTLAVSSKSAQEEGEGYSQTVARVTFQK